MGVRVNTNIPSIFARRQTDQTANRIGRNLERLASGLRINRAGDDAAGLAIAEILRAEVRQLNQEVNNIQTGINLAQTAEGGLAAQGEVVGRIRELAVQAANGTLTDVQRAALNTEAQELRQQIEDVAQNTEFNGTELLNGTAGPITLDVEGNLEVTPADTTVGTLGLDTLDLSTQEGAVNALAALDNAATQINQNRATIGAQENRLERAITQREIEAVNQQDAESRIRDLDIAQGVMDQMRDQTLLQGGLAALIQGNLQSETALRLLGG